MPPSKPAKPSQPSNPAPYLAGLSLVADGEGYIARDCVTYRPKNPQTMCVAGRTRVGLVFKASPSHLLIVVLDRETDDQGEPLYNGRFRRVLDEGCSLVPIWQYQTTDAAWEATLGRVREFVGSDDETIEVPRRTRPRPTQVDSESESSGLRRTRVLSFQTDPRFILSPSGAASDKET